ncbi:sensor histidine kinase [Altererythrobacter aurantiacus]|uniref:Sensor histidine kinase n=1 Tax=Parapontixanthobacter aurantiacus TaxID=1463599 RepID=A0A844ZGH7_9SPHN|nr:histidine kinase [Parapontixanthobacter aurantiacus]MXO86868.1 sensor histidine kinase [Parapontixanthobacter aurantiacus]
MNKTSRESITAEPTERVPLKIVLASIIGLWVSYFIIFTLRGWVVGLDVQGELMLRRGAVMLAGAGATFGLWLVLRLFDPRPLAIQVTAAIILAMPTAMLIAQANQFIFADLATELESKMAQDRGFSLRRDENGNIIIETPNGGEGSIDDAIPGGTSASQGRVVLPGETSRDQWTRLIELALSQYFLLIAWSAIYFALLAGAQAKAAERREGEFRRAAKAAELRSLRYQVNPHFLFNTLNSLSSLVMTGKTEAAEEMIQALSSFYRHSLTDEPTMDVPLDEEIALQRHYLEVEAVRFPSRLRTRFEYPQELGELKVPGMILQPLVENSVKYAVAANSTPTTITIAAREEFDRLVLSVSDDGGHKVKEVGGGAEAEAGDRSPKNGFGIGLANVRDRLAARFGDRASLTSGPTLDGYETEIRMPLVTHG